jgi:hypothetical protein
MGKVSNPWKTDFGDSKSDPFTKPVSFTTYYPLARKVLFVHKHNAKPNT